MYVSYFTRHSTLVKFHQSVNKTVTFSDSSVIKGAVNTTKLPYDYLVYAVGAETQTFGIPGVKEHACFMKELHDAEKVRISVPSCEGSRIDRLPRCKIVSLIVRVLACSF